MVGATGKGNGKLRVRRKEGIRLTMPGSINVPMKNMNRYFATLPLISLLLAYAASEVTGMLKIIVPKVMIEEFRKYLLNGWESTDFATSEMFKTSFQAARVG
jgi:flagellar motor switch protein FliM